MIAGQISVEGKTLLAPEDGQKTDFHLKAPGGISLTNGRINHLVISGQHMKYNKRNFEKDIRRKRKPKKEVDLAGAQINVLEINAKAQSSYERYPKPVRLSNTVVSSWRLYDDDPNNEDSRMQATHFIELFKDLYPYSQTAYMQAERFLRDSGYDNEATEIYVKMKQAAFKQRSPRKISSMNYERSDSKLYNVIHRGTGHAVEGIKNIPSSIIGSIGTLIGILIEFILYVIALPIQFFLEPVGRILQTAFRRPLHIIFHKLLMFGTNPTPLMFIIAILYASSVFFVFSDPRNIQPSLEGRAVTIGDPDKPPKRPPLEKDTPETWGLWRSAAVSLRYHIPIITTYAEDDWEAKSDEPLYLRLPNLTCKAWQSLGQIWSLYLVQPVSAFFKIDISVKAAPQQLDKSTTNDPSCSVKIENWSAQGWATMMSILNYIMWPLLLAFLLRTLLRLERN